MNAKNNENAWHIEVCPRSAGNYGGFSISGIEYSESEAVNLQNDIMHEIKRHVNDISQCNVVYDGFICECGNEYETFIEAENCCKNEQ